jgi:hypothetical protein
MQLPGSFLFKGTIFASVLNRSIAYHRTFKEAMPMTPERTKSEPGPYTGTDPRLEIIEYLHLHPYAADTVDGIIHWWLSRQRYETAKAVIQRALDDLVNQGVIDCVQAADNTRVFRLSLDRKSQEPPRNE